jgi:hypothetical protein
MLLVQPACLFRKHKAPSAPVLPQPTRIAFLPLNVPQGTPDLQWIAIASAVVAANTALAAPDLQPAPLWESIPAAIQSLGNSRTLTSDIAQTAGERISAKWTTEGEVRADKSVITICLDFTPSKTSVIPFRYERPVNMDRIGLQFQDALDQFLRYLVVRPIPRDKIQEIDARKLKAVAEAMDLEYGWFATSAKPGAAAAVVEDLVKTNLPLAKLLFNPSLYPALAK